MEEAQFQTELSKYRRVRPATYKAGAPPPKSGGPARLAGAAAPPPPPRPLPPTLAAPYPDLWAGLDALLAHHYGPSPAGVAAAKAAARVVDASHYGWLKGLNLDDIEDVAAMIQREVDAQKP